MVVAYLRVSTSKQHLSNQKEEIEAFAVRNGLHIDLWVKEIASGKKSKDMRRLGGVLRKMTRGDVLIVSEVSRMSRNLTEIMSIVGGCLEKGICVYSIKEKYKFDDSINSKVLCFAFGLVAEIERNLISQRTKEALAKRKADGMKLGRPKGSKNSFYKLKGKERLVKRLLNNNIPKSQIAKKCGVSFSTLKKYLIKHCNL